MRDPEAVRAMFSGISPRYDLLNRVLSAGRDRAWRRAAVALLDPPSGGLALDLCGGTGDLSVELARRGARVVCCDFSGPMLARAARKFARLAPRENGAPGPHPPPAPRCLLADGLRLPFGEDLFDAVTVGFGLRNFRSMEEGLTEIRRVLRPGAGAAILEFSRPTARPLASIYGFYLNRLLPRVGDLVSRREGPYRYLARTIGEFPPAEEVARLMSACGFADVAWTPFTGGIVTVHTARKPG